MMRPLAKSCSRRAFTLLEVIISVVLIALVALSVNRFVEAMLTSIQISTENAAERDLTTRLFRFVDTQLSDLPRRGQGILLGTPHQFSGQLPSDELEWRCTSGQGTLTTAADGEWRVTLMLRPQSQTSSKYDLGLRRRSFTMGTDKDLNWVPLIKDVAGVKFRYYDPRLNAVLDRWQDTSARPLLVYMWIWRHKDAPPESAVFTVNSALAQQ